MILDPRAQDYPQILRVAVCLFACKRVESMLTLAHPVCSGIRDWSTRTTRTTGQAPSSARRIWGKAAYRFFDNTQIDTDGILAPHIAQTLNRMRQVPVVLAIQDTTEFNLSHLHATEGVLSQ